MSVCGVFFPSPFDSVLSPEMSPAGPGAGSLINIAWESNPGWKLTRPIVNSGCEEGLCLEGQLV